MTISAVIEGEIDGLAGNLQRLGWSLTSKPLPGTGSVLVCPSFGSAQLEQCLADPWVGAVETGADGLLEVGPCMRRHLSEGGIGLALRSDTAYNTDLAEPFTRALVTRLLEPGVEIPDLEFVIQEMVSNALLHGNFGVGGIDDMGMGGLDGFAHRVEEALADPVRSARRVEVSASLVGGRLELAVEDQGPGFDASEVHPRSARPHGLRLLEGMVTDFRIEEQGRRAVASLILPARQRRTEALGLDGVRVLVVDDNESNRVLMEALLERMGVGVVELADSGLAGLEAVARRRPDLILLDVMMPGMDGFEMCRRLRQNHPLTELPVIFVTAMDSPSYRNECFASGGNDMVAKPVEARELAARVGVHLRLEQAMRGLRDYQDRVYEELQAARAAQAALSPTSSELAKIHRHYGLVVDGRIESSSELGGDFWTVLPAGPDKVMLMVADFAGHGAAASFNVFRLHLLLSRLPRQIPSPAALLGHLNLELKPVLRSGQFAAAFVGLVDLGTGTITFAAAAMPPPALLCGGQVTFLDMAGPPLGAFADAEYEEGVAEIARGGAALLAYSDALVESLDAAGKPVCTEDDLRSWLRETGPGHSLADEVLARFRDRLPGEPPDDLTLVSIRWP